MAKRHMLIDPIYNIDLIAGALRNWSNPSTQAGQMLLLHGRLDRVVGSENSRYFAEQLARASGRLKAASAAPGVVTAALSFAPNSTDVFPTSNPISDLIFQHGDGVFERSSSVPDTANGPGFSPFRRSNTNNPWNLISQSEQPREFDAARMATAAKSPSQSLRSWLQTACQVDLSPSQ
jgi:hypothetical protein